MLSLQIYSFVAVWLTDLELNRTQTQFDESLSLKIYLLQFVNYYASIFYIAIFKGKFIGYPGEYNRLFGTCACSYNISIQKSFFAYTITAYTV